MVLYKESYMAISRPRSYDMVIVDKTNDYWKLGNHDCRTISVVEKYLQSRNFATQDLCHRSKARAIELLGRCQRGLPPYEFKHRKRELVAEAKRRGLQVSSKEARTHIVQELERSDDDITFRFLDLPCEVRDMVYEFHVDSFDDLPEIYKMPPLARVNWKLGEEILEPFYRRCIFTFAFIFQTAKNTGVSLQQSLPKTKATGGIARFKIQLQEQKVHHYIHSSIKAEYLIDLNNISDVMETTKGYRWSRYPCCDGNRCTHHLHPSSRVARPVEYLEAVLLDMAERPKRKKFHPKDINAITHVLNTKFFKLK